MPGFKIAILSLAFTVAFTGAGRVYSQSCESMPPQSDFSIEEIGTAPGMAMDIAAAKDGRIFWVERHGAFKSWSPVTKTVTTIKEFDVMFESPGSSKYYQAVETGLEGIALDPEFAANHWIYLRYAVPASKLAGLTPHNLGPIARLSRFTLKNGDKEVDLTTEKTILEYKMFAQCCHHGGDVEWGSDGNIWMSTGDNIHWQYSNVNPYQDANPYSDVRATAANTNDLRGKVLRIRPLRFPDSETPAPGVGSTYTIPEGNLRDTWSVDKDKIRPEIYTMGHRNPFSIGIHPDPAKHWLAIGEAGGMDDNGAGGEDEVNVTTKPGYFGWPFFCGNNAPYNQPSYKGSVNPFSNPSAIPNESVQNTGLKILPPAIPAQISIKTGAFKLANTCFGVTWGWIRYDAALDSKAKWPAFLEGKLLVSSYASSDVNVATVDADGKVVKMDKLFSASPFTTDVMKATQGADGAFYVARGDGINFNTSSVSRIYRVAYKGSCFSVSTLPGASRLADLQARRSRIAHLDGNTDIDLPAGIARAEAYGMDGRIVWETRRAETATGTKRTIPVTVKPGILQLRFFRN